MFSKTSINIMTGFSGIFLTTSSKYSLEKAWQVIDEVREVTEKTYTNSDTKLSYG